MALTKSTRKWLAAEQVGADLFHADPASVSAAEAEFILRCRENLRKVHRPSWPDFLVSEDGRLFAVEVKTPFDGLSPNQIRTFDLLSGKIDIYVWMTDRPDRLIPWSRAKTVVKRREK